VWVQVLLLVWDDTTNNMGLHSGLMATHDQETLEYFKVHKQPLQRQRQQLGRQQSLSD
jgi:hypothetical protein